MASIKFRHLKFARYRLRDGLRIGLAIVHESISRKFHAAPNPRGSERKIDGTAELVRN
jgi:hypothetical protein